MYFQRLFLAFAAATLFVSVAVAQQFQAPAYYQVGPSNSEPMGVVAADFNGDGYPDLAVALSNFSQVQVLLNTGTGTFQKPIILSLPASPTVLATSDMNGDGKADLLVITPGRPTILGIYFGTGDGRFTRAGTYRTNSTVAVPAIADFNGDGYPDVAVPWINPSVVVVYFNDTTGNLINPTTNYRATTSPTAIAAGDFNGDGHPDLAVAGGKNSLAILLNNGSGGFSTATNNTVGGESASVAVGDLNQDGKLDVVVACAFAQAVYVLMGNGDGTFAPATIYSTSSLGNAPYSVVLADFNRDGKLDLAVGMFQQVNAAVGLFYGNGDGTLQSPVGYPINNGGSSMIASDLDGDGAPDLAFAMLGGGHVAVLLNTQ